MVLGRTYICSKRSDSEKTSVLLEQRGRPDALLFEGGVVAELAPAETDAVKKLYTKIVEAYGCLGTIRLFIGDSCYLYLFFVTGCVSVGKIDEDEIFRITNCSFIPLQEACELDIRIADVQKLILSGCFFFVWSTSGYINLDLTLSAQRVHSNESSDDRFFWNRSLHFHLQRFGIDCEKWLLKVMCGCMEIRTVYVGAKQAKACLISRLSCERAGTRFNVRGVDDEGHAANFVETEQLIILDEATTSFVQTRGSVPIFWEQPGFQVGSHKVKISRGYEASSPAFDRHISSLKNIYGYQLIVNLLGKKEGENTVSVVYRDHLKDSQHSYDTHMIMFDYHTHCRGGREDLKILLDKAQPSLENFQFFFKKGSDVFKSQAGTIRTNCLDCLDRTNAVQTKFGITILREQLGCLGLLDKPSLVARFIEVYKSLWALNGDHVSKMYSGTGALESGTKGTVASKLHDGAVSVKRTFRSNFLDGSKQGAIDILLLRNAFTGAVGERARALLNTTFLNSTPAMLKELCYRHEEFTDVTKFRVCVGTWNVNGGKHFRSIAYKHQSMHDWLIDFYQLAPEGIIDKEESFERPPDLYALGFEELVDLNTSNIISTSSTQKKEWGSELQRIVSRDHPYVLVTAEQLVGVCLYVFVRAHHVPYIRDVGVDSVKTGLHGSAGNKGAVAIRMTVHSTSLCFVCGHFAAGQSNVQERNSNYHDISRRISFPTGSSLISHDYIFWCGDFNYRIDLPNEECKEMIKQKSWSELRSYDQLSNQKAEGKIFKSFSEGPINFPPTYKYDLFSDDYDTSEKNRVPAWTDRILWRRKQYRRLQKHDNINERTSSLDEEEFDDGASVDSLDLDDDVKEMPKITAASGDVFNPGNLLFYGRAELKTSDHRPVVALVEIELQVVSGTRLMQVHHELQESFGPADPTVIVSSIDQIYEEEDALDIDALLTAVEEFGTVVLVRVIDDEVLLTFNDGKSALNALQMDHTMVGNKEVSVKLKSEETFTAIDAATQSLITIENTSKNETQSDKPRDRTGSDLLDTSRDRCSSLLLEPEKVNEQLDYLEEDEVILDNMEDEVIEDKSQEDIIRERREEMIDSDEEEEKMKHDNTSYMTTRENGGELKKPGPPRPNRPQRPAPPKRPPPPKATSKDYTAQAETEILTQRVPCLNEFDPIANLAQPGSPKPARPAPPRAAPAKPPPPPQRPKMSTQRESVAEVSKETTSPRDPLEELMENSDDIGNPFNVQHLLHVDASNVDQFIAKLEGKADSKPSRPSVLTGAAHHHSSGKRNAPTPPVRPQKEPTRPQKDPIRPQKEATRPQKELTRPEKEPERKAEVSARPDDVTIEETLPPVASNPPTADIAVVAQEPLYAAVQKPLKGSNNKPPPRPKSRPVHAEASANKERGTLPEQEAEPKTDSIPQTNNKAAVPLNSAAGTVAANRSDDTYADTNENRPATRPPLPPRMDLASSECSVAKSNGNPPSAARPPPPLPPRSDLTGK